MNAPETAIPPSNPTSSPQLKACSSDMVELAATLVRFPSLNGKEAGAQYFMEGLFRGMGLEPNASKCAMPT